MVECCKLYCLCILLIICGGEGNRRILLKDFSNNNNYSLNNDMKEYDDLINNLK